MDSWVGNHRTQKTRNKKMDKGMNLGSLGDGQPHVEGFGGYVISSDSPISQKNSVIVDHWRSFTKLFLCT